MSTVLAEPTIRFEDRGFGCNSIEVTHYGDGFNIEIDHPWAGSTETGFGYTLSQRLSRDDALALAEWLIGRAALSASERSER